eukprot:CAMPEP_0173450512 /NCGR_PEP_ID=MMETSP1357-20121228/44914_1 /TAXON_ID=77926 /ORGANISM="Hemiselmis rufescens, Strain PCC563" /LENGTH=419 /DNA_ID=CAMNT_0014417201 /DNA_START=1 /DNA_END=1255 /DNA_ORIENTATION=-
MSSAGKPIFTRYGDEEKLNPIYGVMCSLVNFVSEQGDTLRCIYAGNHKIAFLVRGPVFLVMASRTGEPSAHLTRQLQFLYTQLVSILTRKGLEHVFRRRHGFDLRNLLGASGEQFLSNLTSSMDAHKLSSALPLQTSLSYLLGAPSCLRLPVTARQSVNKALLSVKNRKLTYAVLIAGHKLVQFVRPRKTALWAEDLLIIINLINSSTSFRTSEGSWTPLCLPLYSPDANVFAYICFLSKYGAPDVCLVFISSSDDEFFNLSNSKHSVALQLQESSALGQIQYALRRPSFSIGEVESGGYGVARDVHHFVYVSTAVNQLVAPSFSPPYTDKRLQQQLLRAYQEAALASPQAQQERADAVCGVKLALYARVGGSGSRVVCHSGRTDVEGACASCLLEAHQVDQAGGAHPLHHAPDVVILL